MKSQVRVAVLQSNYVPWRGYFDIIQRSDIFIFYDDVKFTKNDWRNRNVIKGPSGPIWLTIPCPKNYDITIDQVQPVDSFWQERHWSTICQYYKKATCFRQFDEFFREFYLGRRWESLSVLNQFLIEHIAEDFFRLSTEFRKSSSFAPEGVKSSRLLNLLEQAGASVYISGPAARSYIDETEFARRNISIEWMEYTGYPEYDQRFPPFTPNLSVLDLLFNAGADRKYITPQLDRK